MGRLTVPLRRGPVRHPRRRPGFERRTRRGRSPPRPRERSGGPLVRGGARAPLRPRTRNATLSLRDLRPHITSARPGRAVRRTAMAAAIERSLRSLDRTRLRLLVRRITPAVTRSDFGAIVVVRRGSRSLTLYRRMSYVIRFPVAVGTSAYPTPLGRFGIVTKERNPTWNPPTARGRPAWARSRPGPGHPSGRAGWASRSGATASTARPRRPRSAPRPRTAASACTSTSRSGCSSGVRGTPVFIVSA